MKLLHTADIHLDSKLSRHLDPERAKQRRDELLISFRNMVDYAAKEGVKGILIAGDLFDVNKISATARNAVLAAVEDNPEITFFYLKGNHDADGFLHEYMEKKGKAPENLKLFSDTWTSYEVSDDDVVIVVIT